MSTPLEGIKPETVEILISRAKARGLSVDEYLKHLLGGDNGTQGPPVASTSDFKSAMESLAEDSLEPLPPDFSRADIYFSEE